MPDVLLLRSVARLAQFSGEKMGKVTLAAGEQLYAGLNCFLPGQEHAAHTHAGQDKLYLVLEGAGEARIGVETHAVAVGDLILAPAGTVHGMKNTSNEPLTVLVVLAPPPAR